MSIRVGLPGHGLLQSKALSLGEGAFVLLALAAVSFDGFSHTFLWADWLGLNPLEFPGRSTVVFANTLGLGFMALCLAAVYATATRSGQMLAHTPKVTNLVLAIIPIALAYYAAHYLAGFPLDAMRAVKALSDPFGTGADLFGMANADLPASFMMDHHVATLVYRLQTAIIVAGHVMAVAVAHLLALRSGDSIRATVLSQAPLNTLMVLYTVFGLWLLSTPVIL